MKKLRIAMILVTLLLGATEQKLFNPSVEYRNSVVENCAAYIKYLHDMDEKAKVWRSCYSCLEKVALNETENIKRLMVKGCVSSVMNQ